MFLVVPVKYALLVHVEYNVHLLPLLLHLWLWRIPALELDCTDFKKMEIHWHSSVDSCVSSLRVEGNNLEVLLGFRNCSRGRNMSNNYPQSKRLVTHILKGRTETAVSVDERKPTKLKLHAHTSHFCSPGYDTPAL